MKHEMFWKEMRNSPAKENEYFVTLNGKLLPTLEYVQQMFLADNGRIQLTNKLAKIAIVVSIISMVTVYYHNFQFKTTKAENSKKGAIPCGKT